MKSDSVNENYYVLLPCETINIFVALGKIKHQILFPDMNSKPLEVKRLNIISDVISVEYCPLPQ